MQEKKWIFKETANTENINQLAKEINVSTPIATMLLQRGINNFEKAKNFFRPSLDKLHNPFLMKDMDIAIQRLQTAINKQENVLIFGDYDVDGTTSVSLMYLFLKDKIKNLHYYIPNRYTEGYGISTKGIDFAENNNCSLIIALDCGIKATDKVEYANSKNIDFIIIDHHEQGENLPKAVAVLDPKRKDCEYPFKELSACGVGFKLIQAFAIKNNIPFDDITYLLDLVVVSIASDIVPIVNENRILAYYGLKKINSNPQKGLKAIMNIAKANIGNLQINDLVFKIGPRINAAGRIDKGVTAVDLLTTNNTDKIIEKVEIIDQNNSERKELDRQITEHALYTIKQNDNLKNKKTTVLYNKQWHKGVIGIVASRLIDEYYRPTIIFTESNGKLTGSARSVRGFNIYKALEKCQHLILNFGGHAFAAGLTIDKKNFDSFSNLFEDTVKNTITPECETPIIEIDTHIKLMQITPNFFNVIKQFAPFGPGNNSPIFVTSNIKDNGYGKLVGKNKEHLKLCVKEQDYKRTFSAIAFNQKHNAEKTYNNKNFDVCYHLEENNYMGKTSIEMRIMDIKN